MLLEYPIDESGEYVGLVADGQEEPYVGCQGGRFCVYNLRAGVVGR